jgi:hypothetical protein
MLWTILRDTVGSAAIASVILWRFYHPGEEKTVERKVYFIVQGVWLVLNLVQLVSDLRW